MHGQSVRSISIRISSEQLWCIYGRTIVVVQPYHILHCVFFVPLPFGRGLCVPYRVLQQLLCSGSNHLSSRINKDSKYTPEILLLFRETCLNDSRFVFFSSVFTLTCLVLRVLLPPSRIESIQVDTDKLRVPDVCYKDFQKALEKSGSSVSPEELTRFVEWTNDFGQEG